MLGFSERWVYDHWEELGGTRAFGGLKFFRKVFDECIKRRDRRQRPWCYEFRRNEVLYRERGFESGKEAQVAEAEALLKAKTAMTRLEFSEAVRKRLEFVQAYYPKTLRDNITRFRRFASWEHLDCHDITSDMVRKKLMGLCT